jgi:hypothetical protein
MLTAAFFQAAAGVLRILGERGLKSVREGAAFTCSCWALLWAMKTAFMLCLTQCTCGASTLFVLVAAGPSTVNCFLHVRKEDCLQQQQQLHVASSLKRQVHRTVQCRCKYYTL